MTLRRAGRRPGRPAGDVPGGAGRAEAAGLGPGPGRLRGRAGEGRAAGSTSGGRGRGLLLAASPGLADYAEAAGAGGRRGWRTRSRCRRRSGSSSGSTRSPSPSSRPTARRRATSGCSAWPPPPSEHGGRLDPAGGLPARAGGGPGVAARPGGALGAGGERFDPRTIRERIAARYPEAQPLPDRPELDRLLARGRAGRRLGRATGHLPPAGRAARGDLGLARRRSGGARTRGRGGRRGRSTRRWPRPGSSRSGSATPSATGRSWS